MFNYDDFYAWLTDNGLLYKQFLDMKDVVSAYLDRAAEYRLDGHSLADSICKQFMTVLNKCDEISYDEEGVPEAYILLHFLDRYHRFQLTYLDMLQSGVFPLGETLHVMDVGTGPGPSLYALSDIILLLNQYQKETTGEEVIKQIMFDYAEQSGGFRDFMHHVTEMLIQKRDEIYVPYHHGTYWNATEFQLGGKKPAQRSYNMVIYSNFLTNENVVDIFQEQLQKTAYYLRNKGVLLIVGGDPNDKKYKPVYQRINEILRLQKYGNKRFVGGINHPIDCKMLTYSGSCECNVTIQQHFKQMIDTFTENDWSKLDAQFRRIMENYLNNPGETKWYVTVYKRFSFYRRNRCT